MTTVKNPKPCPGCDRARKDCWKDPCAHLRVLKAGPGWKLGVWVVEGGGALSISKTFHLEARTTRDQDAEERFDRLNRAQAPEHQRD